MWLRPEGWWLQCGEHQQQCAGLLQAAEVLLMFHSFGQRLQPDNKKCKYNSHDDDNSIPCYDVYGHFNNTQHHDSRVHMCCNGG